MSRNSVVYDLPHDYFRAVVEKHSTWIERTLGSSLSDCLVLNLELRFDHLVTPEVFAGMTIFRRSSVPQRGVKAVRVEYPNEEAPIVSGATRERGSMLGGQEAAWRLDWGSTPVALWFDGVTVPVVLVRAQYADLDHGVSGRETTLAIVQRQHAPGLLEVLRTHMVSDEQGKTIHVVNGPDTYLKPSAGSWDALVLDPKVTSLVRSDYESFLERKAWFSANDIPFRRGYLLHGPPGNGKTSVIRAMAANPKVTVTTLNWGDDDANDSALSSMFRWASDHAPSLVIMEDLDRHFLSREVVQPRHNITLAHLLNSLDGVTSAEGVVVVATANHPKALDPAILSRPGRFDRVVEFGCPCPLLRAEYIQRRLGTECATLGNMVADSEKFSFAQLREAYVIAGQLAYEKGRERVTPPEMYQAIREISSAIDSTGQGFFNKRAVGFSGEKAKLGLV